MGGGKRGLWRESEAGCQSRGHKKKNLRSKKCYKQGQNILKIEQV